MAPTTKKDKIDQERKIIEKISERPFIYNVRHKDYKDILKKENAFTRIADDLGGGLTGRTVKDIWTNLRAQYLQNLRKLQHPTGTGTKPPPFFRHSSLMGFCGEKHVDNNDIINNLDMSSQMVVSDVEGDKDNEDEVASNDVEPSPPSAASTQMEAADAVSGSSSVAPASTSTSPAALPTTNQKKRKVDEFEKELIGFLKTSTNEEAQKDEHDKFCDSLAPKLRRVTEKDSTLGIELQLEILKLFLEFEQKLVS